MGEERPENTEEALHTNASWPQGATEGFSQREDRSVRNCEILRREKCHPPELSHQHSRATVTAQHGH